MDRTIELFLGKAGTGKTTKMFSVLESAVASSPGFVVIHDQRAENQSTPFSQFPKSHKAKEVVTRLYDDKKLPGVNVVTLDSVENVARLVWFLANATMATVYAVFDEIDLLPKPLPRNSYVYRLFHFGRTFPIHVFGTGRMFANIDTTVLGQMTRLHLFQSTWEHNLDRIANNIGKDARERVEALGMYESLVIEF